MSGSNDALKDFHWMMDVLQFIDVGLVILDDEYNIQLWNAFMQNHSSKDSSEILGVNLFEAFPEVPEAWFRRKADSVFSLHNSAFTTWEQRPYLFKFDSYRPITSVADYMYQNSTIIPLKNTNGQVDHICLIIYDVTETAVNKLQLESANLELQRLSSTDGLTGLLNRKTWEGKLEECLKLYARYGTDCSLIMFDIDHFKRINDGFGHPAGDEAIRQAASIASNCIREVDFAGRYGGEEFAILLTNTTHEGAKIVAERIRKRIQANTIVYDGHTIEYTISLGVAALDASITDGTQWIETADKCLYKAKEGGRNNTVVHQNIS